MNNCLRRWHPRRRGVTLWSSLVLAAAFFVDPCRGAEAKPPSTRSFDIPCDAADKSLKRFSAQSGLEVAFGTEAAAQVKTNAVKGDYTPLEAVDRLLAGTGLVVEADDKTGALTISRDPNGQRAAPTTAGDRPRNQDNPKSSKNPGKL